MLKYGAISLVAILIVGCSRSAPAPSLSPPTPSPSNAATPPGEPAKSNEPAADAGEPATPIQLASPGKSAQTERKRSGDAAPVEKKSGDDSIDGMLARAATAAQSQNFDEVVRIVDDILQKEPEHRKALSLKAQATQLKAIGMLQAGNEADALPLLRISAQSMRKALSVDPNLIAQERQIVPLIWYNEACLYCRDTEPDLDKAVMSLKDAIDAGFRDLAQIDRDPDLNPLREREDFKALRASIEAKQ